MSDGDAGGPLAVAGDDGRRAGGDADACNGRCVRVPAEAVDEHLVGVLHRHSQCFGAALGDGHNILGCGQVLESGQLLGSVAHHQEHLLVRHCVGVADGQLGDAKAGGLEECGAGCVLALNLHDAGLVHPEAESGGGILFRAVHQEGSELVPCSVPGHGDHLGGGGDVGYGFCVGNIFASDTNIDFQLIFRLWMAYRDYSLAFPSCRNG